MEVEKIIFKAKMAEKAERYDDMVEFVKLLSQSKPVLEEEERRLFVAGYKNSVSTRRLAWRQIKLEEVAEATETGYDQVTANYRQVIEDEIKGLCTEVLTMLNKHLISCATDSKSRVEYLKVKGDFYRYLAEVSVEDERKEFSESAAVAYKESSEIAVTEMSPTDPLRLGLALNFSVFFYDTLDMPERAVQIAKAAFNDAIVHLDTVTEENYREVAGTMQLLKDNLALWATEAPSQPIEQPQLED